MAALALTLASPSGAAPRLHELALSRDVVDLDREQGSWLFAGVEGTRAGERLRARWRVSEGEWRDFPVVRGSFGEPRLLAFVPASAFGAGTEASSARLSAQACASGADCGPVATSEVALLGRCGRGRVIDDFESADSPSKAWTVKVQPGADGSLGVARAEGGSALEVKFTSAVLSDGARPPAVLAFLALAEAGGELDFEKSEGLAFDLAADEATTVDLTAFVERAGTRHPVHVMAPTGRPATYVLRWTDLVGDGPPPGRVAALAWSFSRTDGLPGVARLDDVRLVERNGSVPLDGASPLRATGADPRRALEPNPPAGRVQLPLELTHGTPVVTARLWSGDTVRLLLDTGSLMSAIDRSLATRLGLKEEGRQRGGDGYGAADFEVVRLGRLDVGPHAVHGVWAGVADRLPATRPPLHGLLAPSVLDGLVTIDLRRRVVVVEPGALPPSDGAAIFDLEWPGDARVDLPFAGRPMQFLLDTGSTWDMSLSTREAAGLRFLAEPRDVGTAQTALADRRLRGARVAGRLHLGSSWLDDPAVHFEPIRGVIGARILERFAVTLDYVNGRVRLVPHEPGPVQPPPWRNNGLSTRRDGAAATILDVRAGSPAARSKIRAGDRVTHVDGRSVADLSDDEWIGAMERTSALLVERAGAVREIRLEAADLFP